MIRRPHIPGTSIPLHAPTMMMLPNDIDFALRIFERVEETLALVLGGAEFAMPTPNMLEVRATPEQEDLYDELRDALAERCPGVTEIEFIDYDEWDCPSSMSGTNLLRQMQEEMRFARRYGAHYPPIGPMLFHLP